MNITKVNYEKVIKKKNNKTKQLILVLLKVSANEIENQKNKIDQHFKYSEIILHCFKEILKP